MMNPMEKMFVPLVMIGVLALIACGSRDEGYGGISNVLIAPDATIGTTRSEADSSPIAPEVVRETFLGTNVDKALVGQDSKFGSMPGEREKTFASKESPDVSDAIEIGWSPLKEQVASQVAQARIIIRTVDLEVEVSNLQDVVESVSGLATRLGGWVVRSDLSQKHFGGITIRIPSGRLDEVVSEIRGLAIEVKSEVSTSRDVTDEYVDNQARLRNLEATEAALLTLFNNAKKVEDALMVQRALTDVQGQIELLTGRIKLIEQTVAFSLVNVTLRLKPAELFVEGGVGMTTGVGQPIRFRATFKPPEGIDDFDYTWDFGDGSPVVRSTRTALTQDEDTRVTATITHFYHDERDSPYFAEVKVVGTGKFGLAEGEDTVVVTVTRIPTIQVFAGESIVAEEGKAVRFLGSFTWPEGVRDLEFTWDFGDGSAPVTGKPAPVQTTAEGTHIYPNFRPFPFTATLVVTGQSDGGEVEAFSSVQVKVKEGEGWFLAGWSAGRVSKSAVRALSGIGQAIGFILIWAVILSPVWLPLGIAAIVATRRMRARTASPKAPNDL